MGNGGEECIKTQQMVATVAAAGNGKQTQQPTEYVERDGFERVSIAGEEWGMDSNTTINYCGDNIIFIVMF